MACTCGNGPQTRRRRTNVNQHEPNNVYVSYALQDVAMSPELHLFSQAMSLRCLRYEKESHHLPVQNFLRGRHFYGFSNGRRSTRRHSKDRQSKRDRVPPPLPSQRRPRPHPTRREHGACCAGCGISRTRCPTSPSCGKERKFRSLESSLKASKETLDIFPEALQRLAPAYFFSGRWGLCRGDDDPPLQNTTKTSVYTRTPSVSRLIHPRPVSGAGLTWWFRSCTNTVYNLATATPAASLRR